MHSGFVLRYSEIFQCSWSLAHNMHLKNLDINPVALIYFKTKAIVKIFKNAFQTLQLYNKYLNSNKLQ